MKTKNRIEIRIKIRELIILFILLSTINICYAMKVAITVDDIPVSGKLPPHATRIDIANQMLMALKKHHIYNTYGFINGIHTENKRNWQIMINWLNEHQLLGNHTFSHLDLDKVTADEYIKDIEENDPILIKLMPNKNYKYFRYAYLAEGDTLKKRNQVRQYLFSHHYQIAQVTIDFHDYEWNAPYARCLKKGDNNAIDWLKKSYIKQSLNALVIAHSLSEQLFGRDVKNILLLHIGAFDALMLDDLLNVYEKKGVEFITLPDALTDSIYKINPNINERKSYTFLNQIRLMKSIKNPQNVSDLYKELPSKKLKLLCR